MNEFKTEQNENPRKPWLIYSILLSFVIGFILGYQIPVDFLSKEPIFVDLSQQSTNEPTVSTTIE